MRVAQGEPVIKRLVSDQVRMQSLLLRYSRVVAWQPRENHEGHCQWRPDEGDDEDPRLRPLSTVFCNKPDRVGHLLQ